MLDEFPKPIQANLEWAINEENIRSVILVGSRATDKHDPLSDYDLSIFYSQPPQYISNDQWLKEIGNVWICVHETIHYRNQKFPTRLVIFEGGIKVDFAFLTLDLLKNIVSNNKLPLEYDMGYKVLIDKDSITKQMAKPSFKPLAIAKPTEAEFLNIVNEFWFETYHVAVYLKRGDLWSSNFRLSGLHHQFLLRMIEWNELGKRGWGSPLPELGKKMQLWVSKETWKTLHQSFAHFDEKDIWNALNNTMNLFRKLSHETASLIGYSYPKCVDTNISNFINRLRTQKLE